LAKLPKRGNLRLEGVFTHDDPIAPELESSIKAAVHNGTFANVDDAMAQAARLLLRWRM
jgi:hypothetical protein